MRKGEKIGGGIRRVSEWVNERNNLCVAIGDCGNSKNYIGVQGYQAKNAVIITKNIGD